MDEQTRRAIEARVNASLATRAVEHLTGIIDGIMADGVLHDQEVLFLKGWLATNPQVAEVWPGSAIARAIRLVLEDGVISPQEREHLLDVLRQLSTCDFASAGSLSPEVSSLPIDDAVTVRLANSAVCHTGTFLFGTRAAVERATSKAGGMPVDSISRRVDYVVIGTQVTASWKHTGFGTKIERAKALQEEGHEIEIISEQRWLVALQETGN